MTSPTRFVFWVYGDVTYAKLTASVDDLDSSVYDLKHVILGILNSQLKGEIRYSCDSINLYEAGYPYGCLKEKLENFVPRSHLCMEGIRALSYYFPQGPERHQLHVIAQLPPTIYCWRFGDKFSQYFKIHIDHHKCPTSRLKEAIHGKMQLYGIDVAEIELFKVSVPLKEWKEQRPAVKLKDSLHPGLSNVFPKAPSPKHLHIVVLLPQDKVSKPKETFTITDHSITEVTSNMNKQFQRLTIYLNECPPPDTSAKHIRFTNSQRDLPLTDGSVDPGNPSASTGPPIQLFHTAFGHFLDDLNNENLLVPDAFLRKTVQYMRTSSRIYEDGDAHRNMIKQTFPDLLGVIEDQNSSAFGHDGITFTSKSGISIMIVESTRTLSHDPDPATKACFSMTRYWMNPLRQNLRRETCCPTFLVAVGGPWLTIIGGIMTEYAIFQRLTDYVWLGIDSVFSDSHYRRIGRIMYALKRALNTLDAYYLALPESKHTPPQRLYSFEPSIDSYLNKDGTLVKFKYISKTEANPGCVTFLAETLTEAPRRVIVKFVERYNADAHRLVATVGLAPALYYCGKVSVRAEDPSYGRLKMVVVEFIQGSTLYNRQALPASIVDQIKRALAVLHSNGYVFGNLRRPNILITVDDQVRLTNFELAGLEGKDRYPLRIAPLDEFADGTQGCSLLKTQDDIDMLGKVAARPAQETGLPLKVLGRYGYFG